MEPDFSQDSAVWDSTETVQYFAKSAELPPMTGVSVAGVYFDEVSKTGPLATQERTVELPGRILAALTTPIVPVVNDIIQRADGSRWVIKKVGAPVGVDWQVQVVKGNK